MDEVMQIKLEMSKLGWDVEEKITKTGWKKNTGYHIWFRRSEWHGKLTYSITGHEVFFVGTTRDVNNYAKILSVVKSTAAKAKKAWDDYPDTIPYQTATGEVRTDIMFKPFTAGQDIPTTK